MVNIGEGKKFLTEWMDMDKHGFTKKDVEKRKKACEKTGTLSKTSKGSQSKETENKCSTVTIWRMGLNT